MYDGRVVLIFFFFFFNDTATTEIYTLSLHDALPIYTGFPVRYPLVQYDAGGATIRGRDRKSTRLNSSHGYISYAVFCLKKKKTYKTKTEYTLQANLPAIATEAETGHITSSIGRLLRI